MNISQSDKSETKSETIQDNISDIEYNSPFIQENERIIIKNTKQQDENENDEFSDNPNLDIESSLLYIEEIKQRIKKDKEKDSTEEFIKKLDFLADRCILCYFNQKKL